MFMRLNTIGPFALVGFLVLAPDSRANAEDAPVDFTRDIRPILAENCFQCHGPDPESRVTELRLDVRSSAVRDREGSQAIRPGDSAASELLKRVTSKDPDVRMPPPDSKKTLSDEQIRTLEHWIDAGAEWSTHWAFVPPVLPELPDVRHSDWIAKPIDAFILAKQEAHGLVPAPQADATTLVRRLYLDLIGLPPSPDELDQWVERLLPRTATDRGQLDETAYAQLVDDLLSSPHYGERWGQHWLDAARYADSDGFEKDKPRFVWFYRDWVVNAFNNDLPYNQFIIEQIAGDELPQATQDQHVATGFLRNSMINEEGGIDPEQFRMEAMFDRMDAIGKGVLGLTIGCAQCHSHKYDPLTHEEYYRLFAFLNSCHEANIAVYTPDEQMRRASIFAEIDAIEGELQHNTADWPERMARWEQQVQQHAIDWTVVRPREDTSGGQKHYVLDDASVLAAGYAPTRHETNFVAQTDAPRITAVRLELLNDPRLPRGGPGRSIFGLCALTEFFLVAAPADDPAHTTTVKIARALADANPEEQELDAIFDDRSDKRRVTGPIEYAIDRNDETAWGIDIGAGRSNVPRQAVFVLEQPFESPSGAVLTFKLKQRHGGWNSDDNQNNNLGRFRFAVATSEREVTELVPSRVQDVLEVPAEERSSAQTSVVFRHWLTTVPEFSETAARIESLWRQHPHGATQLVLKDREAPRATSILSRGDFLQPVSAVEPGTPAFLHTLSQDAPPTRLTFARWLTDEQSPTTARAFVNRVWQAYFGRGIVGTSEDLGTQSETPSHPGLLDWLAVTFMQEGWSVKKLHRLIVCSSTYRQSSHARPLPQDPENRLLSRFPRQRVEGEIVRDIALAASGLLNPAIGGPSVYPPVPDFLFQPPASYGPKTWKEESGPNRYRRSIYTFRFRSVPYPVLQNFDAPNGDVSCVRRTQSNTPLQALTTLNETLFVECARALALRTLQAGGESDGSRMTYAFRRCVARHPGRAESAELLRLLQKQKDRFAEHVDAAWQLAANDAANPPALPEGATPADAAAWTVVSRVLLNLDETITKE